MVWKHTFLIISKNTHYKLNILQPFSTGSPLYNNKAKKINEFRGKVDNGDNSKRKPQTSLSVKSDVIQLRGHYSIFFDNINLLNSNVKERNYLSKTHNLTCTP